MLETEEIERPWFCEHATWMSEAMIERCDTVYKSFAKHYEDAGYRADESDCYNIAAKLAMIEFLNFADVELKSREGK